MRLKQFCKVAVGAFGLMTALEAAEPDFRTDINPALLYFQAFQNLPQLSDQDSHSLFEWSGGAWPAEVFNERQLGLLKQFDNTFKLVKRARFARVPCDWGYDLSDGPEALLPGLAPAKRVAQVTRLRAMAHLDEGRFDMMREEFSSAFKLGRNLSTDHILISCLVQIAVENILTSVIMENYYRLPQEHLDQMVAAFDTSPKRGTMAETIGGVEREAFFGYIQRKVTAMIEETKGNDDLFWKKFEPFWNPIATEFESRTGPDPSAERVKEAAVGKSAEILRLLDELPPLYVETARVMALPYPQYKQQAPALFGKIEDSTNPFVKQFFTVFKNIRAKEFGAIVRQEMVRAAAAYKRGGRSALESIEDPLVGGPFEFTRVKFEGVDRGFRLRSKEQFRDFDEVMIFLEKPGEHFRLDGKNAGKPS